MLHTVQYLQDVMPDYAQKSIPRRILFSTAEQERRRDQIRFKPIALLARFYWLVLKIKLADFLSRLWSRWKLVINL